MEILYLLIPLSVILVFAIGAAFWWSLRSGQYEDLEGPAHRILMDNDKVSGNAKSAENIPESQARHGRKQDRPSD